MADSDQQILLSFMIVVGLTIICTVIWLVAAIMHALSENRTRGLAMTISSRLILIFGDQQIVTGITLLLTAHIRSCDISAYHYITALMLATMSSSVHMTTMIVLTDYMRKYAKVALCRILGIITHLGLTCWAILKVILWSGQEADSRWSIQCTLVERSFVGLHTHPVSVVGYPHLVNIFMPSLSIFISACGMSCVFILHSHKDLSLSITIASSLLLLVISICVFLFLLFWILKVRAEMQPHMDVNENAWGFGQIMAFMSVLACILSAVGIYNGKFIQYFECSVLSFTNYRHFPVSRVVV